MELKYFQRGFNYSQDGPGNRLVYHLVGCNMRCPWCSNPEGMETSAAGRVENVEAVAASILAARPMFFDSGGVTLTGGEVAMQFDAVKALLSALQKEGVNTCIETNASHPRLPELFGLLNEIIADFKLPDEERHRRWTGIGNERIRQNIRAAADCGLPLQLRVPLIHGVNDDEAALEGFIDFFSKIQRPGMTVEFLRYHEYGKEKWAKLQKPYAMKDAFLPEGVAERFEGACRDAGIEVIRT